MGKSETRSRSSINNEVHRHDWTNRQGGGVFVAVKKDLKSSRQSEIETDCENVWVKLEIPNSPNIYIYLPIVQT